MCIRDSLFTGTVADNIRYGKLDATDAEVTAAAQLAGAHASVSYTHLCKGPHTGLPQPARHGGRAVAVSVRFYHGHQPAARWQIGRAHV